MDHLNGQSNVLKIVGGSSALNENALIKVDISNDQSFISFQCDIVLPSSMSYIEESAALSERAKDHVLNVSEIQANKVRLFAYSLNNKKFKGDSGTVASFEILSGNQEGTFELIVESAIIGDSLSHNIITDSVNGVLTVSPIGIHDHQVTSILDFTVSPNPFITQFSIELHLKEPAELFVELLSLKGKVLASNQPGWFDGGLHTISGESFLDSGTIPEGVSMIKIYASGKDKRLHQKTIKIIKTKP